jgi:hypothetical protein
MVGVHGICFIDAMQALENLLKNYARRKWARWWLGERPEGRYSHMARIIAGKVDYPMATEDPFANKGMVALDRMQAAHVLAVAGTTASLMAGRCCGKSAGRKRPRRCVISATRRRSSATAIGRAEVAAGGRSVRRRSIVV